MAGEKSPQEWLAVSQGIFDIYHDPNELGREHVDDSQALGTWLMHWREGGHDLNWIRDQIRQSPEWQNRHSGGQVPEPSQPSDPIPIPDNPGPSPTSGRNQVIRLSAEQFKRRMYSYWSNSFVTGDNVFTFAGHSDGYPRLFQTSKRTGQVTQLPTPDVINFPNETEGWSFAADGTIYLIDGPRYVKVNIFTGERRVIYDVSNEFPGHILWQPHFSPDGNAFSATLQQSNDPWRRVATVVFRHGVLKKFDAVKQLDESALVGSDWLLIKEADDNRVINLNTMEERWIGDWDRALGHSDSGSYYAIGEADKPDPGQCGLWDYRDFSYHPLFNTLNMGHVSVIGDRCLLSNNDIIAWLDKNTGQISHIINHGQVVTSSENQIHANLDPSATVATYIKDGSPHILLL